jgi:hypothetical protein
MKETNEMKPSLTLTLIVVALLFACARGSAPTAPSQPSNPVQQSNPMAIRLSFVPNPAVVNEATTFIASGPSSASATLDFGDGTRADFGPLSPVNSAALKHIYTLAGEFTATFAVTDGAGNTASVPVLVVVR